MDGETEQSAFDELVEMERQSGLEAPEIPPGVDTEIMRQPLVYEDPAEPATRAADVVASEGVHPFKLIDASEGGTQKVRVVYGTVAGSMPTGMSLGDNPPYVLTVTGSGIIYLVVTTDVDGVVDSRSIGDGASLPADTGSSHHLEIGSYSVTAGVLSIGQAVSGSQAFELCGGAGGEPTWGLI